jgi:hypothetical protein
MSGLIAEPISTPKCASWSFKNDLVEIAEFEIDEPECPG